MTTITDNKMKSTIWQYLKEIHGDDVQVHSLKDVFSLMDGIDEYNLKSDGAKLCIAFDIAVSYFENKKKEDE